MDVVEEVVVHVGELNGDTSSMHQAVEAPAESGDDMGAAS